MKTLIRTIAVFVALNLVAGNFALAQNTPEEEYQQAIVETVAAAQRQAERVREEQERAQKEIEWAREDRMISLFRGGGMSASTPNYFGAGKVLVIPVAEINTQDLITIMEDMSVMSHILAKKIGQERMAPEYYFFISQDSCATEAIYLGGYGALFLMKVDFPLSPPAEAEEKQIEEPADPVWEETKQEIYAPKDVERRRERRRSEAEYNAEKVEDLKRKLIKALKHSANIRNLKPDEWVILTVTGGGESGRLRIAANFRTVVKKNDKAVTLETGPTQPDFSSPTVLTIRVKKADVDAFAKEKLDFDQFCKRLQIFTY